MINKTNMGVTMFFVLLLACAGCFPHFSLQDKDTTDTQGHFDAGVSTIAPLEERFTKLLAESGVVEEQGDAESEQVAIIVSKLFKTFFDASWDIKAEAYNHYYVPEEVPPVSVEDGFTLLGEESGQLDATFLGERLGYLEKQFFDIQSEYTDFQNTDEPNKINTGSSRLMTYGTQTCFNDVRMSCGQHQIRLIADVNFLYSKDDVSYQGLASLDFDFSVFRSIAGHDYDENFQGYSLAKIGSDVFQCSSIFKDSHNFETTCVIEEQN